MRQPNAETDSTEGSAPLRMADFDLVARARSPEDLLRGYLEDAEEQQRTAGRRARKAQKRFETLSLVVESWEELVADYERTHVSSAAASRN